MAEDESAPATKKDLTELEARIDTKLSGLEATMDTKLDTKLSELEARIDTKLDTKLSDLESRMDTKLDTKLSEVKAELSEQMRDMQTEILKAFLPWQESVHTQFRKLEANMGNNVTSIEQRMGILERRLWEIEKRLLMNPPAA